MRCSGLRHACEPLLLVRVVLVRDDQRHSKIRTKAKSRRQRIADIVIREYDRARHYSTSSRRRSILNTGASRVLLPSSSNAAIVYRGR